MHERALRTVLLIRSIDEADLAGEVLPLTDRIEATRAARPEGRRRPGPSRKGLSRDTERLLVRRAELLLDRLRSRSPAVARLLALAGGASWLGPVLVGLAFASGVSLSALDGSHRIDMLAFPLIGLIAWNAVVYVFSIAASLPRRRRQRANAQPRAWLAELYERWLRRRVESLLRSSSHFNVPLSRALSRFAHDWTELARPLLVLRAKRLMHLCAASVALGLCAGLYARGIVLRYDAGWESTFLSPGAARTLIRALYGPAAALTGIALPAADEAMQALRWQGQAGGAPAAPWIHLIATTALLYIVLPRLLLVLSTSAALARRARRPALPPGLAAYARALLLQSGDAPALAARVVTYAYEPARESLDGLGALLSGALGGAVEVTPAVRLAYGQEDAFAAQLREAPLPAADCHVLLLSLAATPEPENHGAVISALAERVGRDAGPDGLLVLVDEAPYAARMRGDASFERRMEERRAAWREFAERRGRQACIVDLSRVRTDDAAAAARANVLTALQWTASR